MFYRINVLLVSAIGIFLAVSVSAQDTGRNGNAMLVLDFQTTSADTLTLSVIDAQPQFYTVDVNGQTRTRFNTTFVLQGAVDLVGMNCDLVFDKNVLQVIDIHEARGDLNFDGRSNIADVLTLAERFNEPTNTGNGYSFLDRDSTGASANVIDMNDINAILTFINENSIFWTSNPNHDLSIPLRESVEIFENPSVSNANGRIKDLVVTLLSRIHPIPAGFGFDGDARIADLTFEVIGDLTNGTTIRFENTTVIDEGTQITQEAILNASTPQTPDLIIRQP